MAKIAVAGHRGFIGSSLVRALNKSGITAETIEGKIQSQETADSLVEGCNTLYICAGVTGGSGLLASDPLSLVTPNLLIHAYLFKACKKMGVRKVICLSSTTGYPDSDAMMLEDDYFKGELHGAYFNPGHTRRFIERLGQMYPELHITFFRPSVVYGPGDDYDPETSHVIPALVRKVAERHDPITIWGNGENWRDAVYIDDVIRALMIDAPAGAFNLASGDGMTVIQILETLRIHAGYHPDVKYDLSKPAMLKKRMLNIEKAKDVLGWEPTVDMRTGLRRTLDLYASQ